MHVNHLGDLLFLYSLIQSCRLQACRRIIQKVLQLRSKSGTCGVLLFKFQNTSDTWHVIYNKMSKEKNIILLNLVASVFYLNKF